MISSFRRSLAAAALAFPAASAWAGGQGRPDLSGAPLPHLRPSPDDGWTLRHLRDRDGRETRPRAVGLTLPPEAMRPVFGGDREDGGEGGRMAPLWPPSIVAEATSKGVALRIVRQSGPSRTGGGVFDEADRRQALSISTATPDVEGISPSGASPAGAPSERDRRDGVRLPPPPLCGDVDFCDRTRPFRFEGRLSF